MSVEALGVVFNHSAASGTAKVVMLGIANHDGDAGAFPSIRTLARYCNVAPRSVQRALEQLEEMGELEVLHQEGGSLAMPWHLRPNLYVIRLDCPEGCDRTMKHRVTPASPGDASVRGAGDASVTRGVTSASPLNRKKNHPLNHTSPENVTFLDARRAR